MKRFTLIVSLLILTANLLTSCGGTPCEKWQKQMNKAYQKMQSEVDPAFATDDQIKESMWTLAEYFEAKDELARLGC